MVNRAGTSAALVALVLAACSVDPAGHPGARCEPDGTCPADSECFRGFCVVAPASCAPDQPDVACSERGVDGLTPVGRCRPGVRRCVDGVAGECEGEVLPADADPCDGIDDDCDGTTDEDVPAECATGDLGACGDGAPACRSGTIVCARLNDPAVETCDDTDEDCDGVTDEGLTEACYPAGDGGCTDSDGDGVFECTGACNAGEVRCEEGAPTACVGAVARASAETCGVMPAGDENCDGQVDEGCPCTDGMTQPCYGGTPGTVGTGRCAEGVQRCEGGMFGPCEGDVVDVPETCGNPGSDDDCNGTDDDIPMLGMSCMGMLPGVCAIGSRACVGDTLTCVTAMPRPEQCNGRDDDCDGMRDEDFDLSTDPSNCGGCGVSCAGSSCCGGSCVDASSSSLHCGACGNACAAGQTCCSGTCVDTSTDLNHCGACGAVCPGDCCGGTCTDVSTDATNCGTCGTACGPSQMCCGGTCAAPTAPACTGCPTDCSAMGQSCCSGSCVDTTTDEMNCGGCGTMCPGGRVCCGGACVPSNELACGQSCAACASSQLCCSGACVDEGPVHCNACGSACPAPNTCCGDGCFNLMTDATHCGSCMTACTAGQICSSGNCCPSGQTWCSGACVDTQTDESHCGRCGNRCGIALTCRGGSCGL